MRRGGDDSSGLRGTRVESGARFVVLLRKLAHVLLELGDGSRAGAQEDRGFVEMAQNRKWNAEKVLDVDPGCPRLGHPHRAGVGEAKEIMMLIGPLGALKGSEVVPILMPVAPLLPGHLVVVVLGAVGRDGAGDGPT